MFSPLTTARALGDRVFGQRVLEVQTCLRCDAGPFARFARLLNSIVADSMHERVTRLWWSEESAEP